MQKETPVSPTTIYVQERTMESETTARLERILLKIVEYADSGMAGSSSYALDRLKAIRDVAAYGIREDSNAID